MIIMNRSGCSSSYTHVLRLLNDGRLRAIDIAQLCSLSALSSLPAGEMKTSVTGARSGCVARRRDLGIIAKPGKDAFSLRWWLFSLVVQPNVFECFFIGRLWPGQIFN